MSAGAKDRWGVRLQSGSREAVQHFNVAVEELVSLSGDPLSAAEDAVHCDDGLILGHVLRAYLCLYSASPNGIAKASEILHGLDGVASDADEREVLHLRAARAWASGEWVHATRALERALLHEPRDLLALKIAQDLYFLLGQSEALREVVARVLTAWPPEEVGGGYVQGMYAFGLEENAEYRVAEQFARLALEQNQDDVWATHALAHVFEMEGRTEEGIAFLTESAERWQTSYFAIHNWWHRALYHLERGELNAGVALYDGPIRRGRSSEWLDVADAASLLWRLSLYGVDVRTRAQQLSLDVEPLLGESVYVFNDWHAVMAFALAGRDDLVEQVITGTRRSSVGSNRVVVEQVGLRLLEAFSSFALGRFDHAADALSDALPSAGAVGGSHAQRDVINLTLITAAARSGQVDYASALVSTRAEHHVVSSKAAEHLLLTNAV